MASRPVNLKWGSVRFVVIWMVSESRLIRNDRKVRCFFEAEWIRLGLGWTAQWSQSVALVTVLQTHAKPSSPPELCRVRIAASLPPRFSTTTLRCCVFTHQGNLDTQLTVAGGHLGTTSSFDSTPAHRILASATRRCAHSRRSRNHHGTFSVPCRSPGRSALPIQRVILVQQIPFDHRSPFACYRDSGCAPSSQGRPHFARVFGLHRRGTPRQERTRDSSRRRHQEGTLASSLYRQLWSPAPRRPRCVATHPRTQW